MNRSMYIIIAIFYIACIAGLILGIYYYRKNTVKQASIYTVSDGIPDNSCSKMCGGGFAIAEIVCVDKNGTKVDDSLCKSQPKPSALVPCNSQVCPAK